MQSDTASALARARTLYFEARFKESVALLLPLDTALRADPQRRTEKIDIKLQLALAHIGLSETSNAKSRFSEICELDPEYSLDPQRYAPKVISLFEEAKADRDKVRCQSICAEANRLVAEGNTDALLALIQSTSVKCPCLESAAADQATQRYQQGLEAYKRNDLSMALQNFRSAAKLQPGHELALPYIELIQNQLRLTAEKSVLDWRAAFDARDFGLAVAIFRQLEKISVEDSSAEALEKIRTGYRQQLLPLIEAAKRACSAGDAVMMEAIQKQADEFLPDRTLGQDLTAEIGSCAKKDCLQLKPEDAMSRLVTRDNPKVPKGMTRPMTVQAKIRIDEKGRVTDADPQTADPAIRDAAIAAAATWKFLPATIENATRCVESQIPIVFNP